MKPFPHARSILAAGLLSICPIAFAHAPVFDCFIEQDAVKCEAGFSDGSSAAGRKVQVRAPSGKVLLEGVLDKDARYSFHPPAKDYSVLFIGGDGHDITLQSSDITK